jgi:hypothetical protein
MARRDKTRIDYEIKRCPLLLSYESEESQTFLKPINKTFASQKHIQDNICCIKLQLSSICNVTRSVD